MGLCFNCSKLKLQKGQKNTEWCTRISRKGSFKFCLKTFQENLLLLVVWYSSKVMCQLNLVTDGSFQSKPFPKFILGNSSRNVKSNSDCQIKPISNSFMHVQTKLSSMFTSLGKKPINSKSFTRKMSNSIIMRSIKTTRWTWSKRFTIKSSLISTLWSDQSSWNTFKPAKSPMPKEKRSRGMMVVNT